jgi:hypothetical protein
MPPKKQNAPGRNTESILPKSARSDDYITIAPRASLGDGGTLLGYLTDQYRQCVALARERQLIDLDDRGAATKEIFKHPRELTEAP